MFKVSHRFFLCISFAICVNLFSGSNKLAFAGIKTKKFYNPISVEIRVKKDSFRVGEAVEGVVIVHNAYMASLPAVFNIRLFREGKVFSEVTTSVKQVPLGTTKFTFKEFGIPYFNSHPGAEGKWSIFILQKDLEDSNGAEVALSIVPPAMSRDGEQKTNKPQIKKLF